MLGRSHAHPRACVQRRGAPRGWFWCGAARWPVPVHQCARRGPGATRAQSWPPLKPTDMAADQKTWARARPAFWRGTYAHTPALPTLSTLRAPSPGSAWETKADANSPHATRISTVPPVLGRACPPASPRLATLPRARKPGGLAGGWRAGGLAGGFVGGFVGGRAQQHTGPRRACN